MKRLLYRSWWQKERCQPPRTRLAVGNQPGMEKISIYHLLDRSSSEETQEHNFFVTGAGNQL